MDINKDLLKNNKSFKKHMNLDHFDEANYYEDDEHLIEGIQNDDADEEIYLTPRFRVNDSTIGEEACNVLTLNPCINASQILVSIHKGTITLHGTVNETSEKIEAERCLKHSVSKLNSLLERGEISIISDSRNNKTDFGHPRNGFPGESYTQVDIQDIKVIDRRNKDLIHFIDDEVSLASQLKGYIYELFFQDTEKPNSNLNDSDRSILKGNTDKNDSNKKTDTSSVAQ